MANNKTIQDVFNKPGSSGIILQEHRSQRPDPIPMFIERNGCFPSTIEHSGISLDNPVKTISRMFNIKHQNIIQCSQYTKTAEGEDVVIDRGGLLEIRPDLYLQIWPEDGIYWMRAFYCLTTDKKTLDKLSKYLSEKQKLIHTASIGVIGHGCNGLFVRFFNIRSPKLSIPDYYNDDFIPIHDKIISRLNDNDFHKGVVLFHGKPGTGKTTYIRYISSIVQKRFLFVPQELAAQIASPQFMSLLMDYPNSILILEDAENIIKDREANDRSPVANILNMSDGLLSDCLNLQIICTFNTDVANIDKALLRKGRIITKYEFKDLNVEKANRLAKKNGLSCKFSSDVSLAEIFNQEDINFVEPRKTVGFKTTIEKNNPRLIHTR